MGRPRKYATDAEAADVIRKNDRLRKRAKHAPAHAAKADPTKRKDAFVNAKNWPAAPLDDKTFAAIQLIVDLLPSDNVRAPSRLFDAAYALDRWEEDHRLRLPKFIELDVTAAEPSRRALVDRWHMNVGTLVWVRDTRIPAARRSTRRHLKEQADAGALGITVAELRSRRETAAIRKWKSKQADAALREQGDRLLEKRARDDAQRLQELADFGRF